MNARGAFEAELYHIEQCEYLALLCPCFCRKNLKVSKRTVRLGIDRANPFTGIDIDPCNAIATVSP